MRFEIQKKRRYKGVGKFSERIKEVQEEAKTIMIRLG